MKSCPCCGDLVTPTAAFPEPPYGHNPMLLHYVCPECSADWTDEWCSAVCGECPRCGQTDIEPESTEDLEVAI